MLAAILCDLYAPKWYPKSQKPTQLLCPLIYPLDLIILSGGHLGLAVWCGVPHCVEDRVTTSRCLFLVISVLRWNVVSLTFIPYSFFFICTCSYMY